MRPHITELETKQSRRKASNGHRLPDPIALGEILTDVSKNQWKIGRSIGVGGFGEIYLASDNLTRSVGSEAKYAIKLEPHGSGPLFVEMNFYLRAAKAEAIDMWKQNRKLKQLGMPNFVSFGSHTVNNIRYRFLVLERYGIDLDKLFVSNGKIFHIKTALTIAIQTLDILEFVHSQGYIHADVKGSNLLLGRGNNRNQVYLLDFGLAGHFLECDGSHKEYVSDERKAHMGTIEFTSRDCHIGACSRRGDLEVLGYNLLYWMCGKLPWEKLSDTPERVYETKSLLMSNIPELLRTCFPRGRPPAGLSHYFQYVVNLEFSANPDYNYCRKLLRKEIKDAGYIDDGNLEFSDFSAIPRAKKLKKQCEKRRKIEEHENISPTRRFVALDSSTPRQPCMAQNCNRMTRNSTGVDNQFSWEKVLSSDPERQLKRKHQVSPVTPKPHKSVDQFPTVVRACYVRNQQITETERIPTPAMLDVINRQWRSLGSQGRKGKLKSCSRLIMSPYGFPHTPEMDRVLQLGEKQIRSETPKRIDDDNRSALPLRSGKKRLESTSTKTKKSNKLLFDKILVKKKEVSMQKGVVMASDVYMVCQNHALCTDQEEIMGLLIGEIKNRVCHISALIMLRRSDKRKDRVEISPIQLTLASSYAEELQRKLGKPMAIVGWYHSHPHITVWPSHVDLGTQAMYQNMEPCFAGIIFSVFTEDKTSKEQEFHMTCFQSADRSRDGEPPNYERVDVPVIIGSQCLTMPCLETMIKLAEILAEEESEAFESATTTSNLSTIAKMMNETVQLYSFLRITDEVTLPLCSVLENIKEIYEEECGEDEEVVERVQIYTEKFCSLIE